MHQMCVGLCGAGVRGRESPAEHHLMHPSTMMLIAIVSHKLCIPCTVISYRLHVIILLKRIEAVLGNKMENLQMFGLFQQSAEAKLFL